MFMDELALAKISFGDSFLSVDSKKQKKTYIFRNKSFCVLAGNVLRIVTHVWNFFFVENYAVLL